MNCSKLLIGLASPVILKMSNWDEFNEDCMHHHGKILTGEFRHFCPEFDYLPIDETVFEFQFCDCYCITWNMNKKRKLVEEMRNESSN
jgi:hypothetical protein